MERYEGLDAAETVLTLQSAVLTPLQCKHLKQLIPSESLNIELDQVSGGQCVITIIRGKVRTTIDPDYDPAMINKVAELINEIDGDTRTVARYEIAAKIVKLLQPATSDAHE